MTNSSEVKQASWSVIAMPGAAQFIMVLDTTVMNVSITQIVEDMHRMWLDWPSKTPILS